VSADHEPLRNTNLKHRKVELGAEKTSTLVLRPSSDPVSTSSRITPPVWPANFRGQSTARADAYDG
jgi:hypothetical protein